MDDNRIKKIVKSTSITAAVATTAVIGVVSYKGANGFTPELSGREYNFNQVHFDGSDDGSAADGNTVSDGDSAFLDSKDDAESDMKLRGLDYMFDKKIIEPLVSDDSQSLIREPDIFNIISDNKSLKDTNSQENSGLSQGNMPGNVNDADSGQMNNNTDANDRNNGILDIVDKDGNVDIIIPGNKPSDIIIPDNSNNKNNTDNNGTRDDIKDDSGDSGNKDNTGNNGNTGDNTDTDNKDQDDDEPDWSDTAKDPEIDKPRPGISNSFDYKPYDEDKVSDSSDSVVRVVIQADSSYDAKTLYKGQTVDAYTIFCLLDTYVIRMENDNPVLYLWGSEAYDKYVKVSGVSFDEGNTWEQEFPVTIPQNLENDNIVIDVGYRLSADDEWTSEKLDYETKNSKLYILSDTIKNDNEVISEDKILNYDQYPDIGNRLNLYRYQVSYIPDDYIDYLFPGWKENGSLVPWIYENKIGRHILQPMKKVPLDSNYVVRMKHKWMSSDGIVDDNGSEYCSLQTLVNVKNISNRAESLYAESETQADNETHADVITELNNKPDAYEQNNTYLEVPMYIQSVELENVVDVDYIKIPETVVYMHNDGINMRVGRGYEVSDDNPVYSSEKGILMSKDKTQIIAIPYRMSSIVIDSNISKVSAGAGNSLNNIIIKAETKDTIPELDYENIHNCNIMINNSILEEYINANYDKLSQTDITVSAYSNPEITYKVGKYAVVNNLGEMCSVIDKNSTSITITDDIKTIKKGVFDKTQINRLTLTDKADITLEEDCLKESQINTIICSDVSQQRIILEQLSYAGKTDIDVYTINTSSEGYVYYSTIENDAIINTLMKAPGDIKEFNGIIDNGKVTINRLDAECFAGCGSLTWVVLPKTVTDIGYEAFAGCSALQGVLIDNRNTIIIGSNAFDGCTSLRYIASNAKNAVMSNDYSPVVTDKYSSNLSPNIYFYVLEDAQGYGDNVNRVSDIGGIDSFRTVRTGDSYMLYGADANGENYVLLRSGTDISGSVKLDTSTMYIYNYAFADAGVTDGFTINWEELGWVSAICQGAFYGSGINGDISIAAEQGIMIYDKAYYGCDRLLSISVDGTIYYLGEEIFINCTSLHTAKFGYIDPWFGNIHAGMFTGCDKLSKIHLSDITPTQLITYESVGFRFNNEWSMEEEAQKLKVIVPEDNIIDYILDWRYAVCGYTGMYSGSAYIDMWNSIQGELIDWDNFVLPEDSEVDRVLKERLLAAENYLRTILGTDIVNEPTDYYPIRLNDGYITLIGIPSDVTEIDFTVDDIGLPLGWYIDYIGESAFAGADNLEYITFADNLAGIYSDAFRGLSDKVDKLTVEFTGTVPVQLMVSGTDKLFDFGIEDDRLSLIVPYGTKEEYIKQWSEYIDKDRLERIITEKESAKDDSGAVQKDYSRGQ